MDVLLARRRGLRFSHPVVALALGQFLALPGGIGFQLVAGNEDAGVGDPGFFGQIAVDLVDFPVDGSEVFPLPGDFGIGRLIQPVGGQGAAAAAAYSNAFNANLNLNANSGVNTRGMLREINQQNLRTMRGYGIG